MGELDSHLKTPQKSVPESSSAEEKVWLCLE